MVTSNAGYLFHIEIRRNEGGEKKKDIPIINELVRLTCVIFRLFMARFTSIDLILSL